MTAKGCLQMKKVIENVDRLFGIGFYSVQQWLAVGKLEFFPALELSRYFSNFLEPLEFF